MRGEHYYLILIGKDGTKYKVFSKPITLKLMDERTTQYENKSDLISTIIKNKNLDMKVSDFKSVEIWMEGIGKKKEEFKRESSPIYKKDSIVLNQDAVSAKFEIKMHDKDYALDFAERYEKVKNFKSLAQGIEAAIRNNGDYIELIEELGEKLFKTYKGTRNIYLSMKKYEQKTKNKISSKPESIEKEVKDSFFEQVDKTEIDEIRLNYLMEHERELLDIEDFNGYENISFFDEHKKK